MLVNAFIESTLVAEFLGMVVLAGRRRMKRLGVSFLAALGVLMIGCTPSHPQSTFDPLGPVAESQLDLFWIIFGVGAFIFVAVEVALIYAAVTFRRHNEDVPRQTHGNNKLEVAWTAVPILILAAVAVPTIMTIFDNTNPPVSADEAAVVVDAIGHQWWFEFRYPHPDDAGKQVVFANELHVPVGETVIVRLASDDVIHSFWVPKIAGKVDMVPNNDNSLWLQADQAGTYSGQCAEFCGVAHAIMRFTLIAEPRADFDAWLRLQSTPPPEYSDPLVQEGKEVFRASGCSGCHDTNPVMNLGPDGASLMGRFGPNLAHLASRSLLAGGAFDNRDDLGQVNASLFQANVRSWLEDPEDAKPGNLMVRRAAVYIDPAKELNEAELSALVIYLTRLK